MTRTRQENIRLRVIFALMIFFFLLAVGRLAHLQLYLGDKYAAIVQKQKDGTIVQAKTDEVGELALRP